VSSLDVIVTGGQLFQATTRGSLLKIGWIGVGLRVEMSLAGRRIVTSPVRSITIEGVPPL
jgi:hypothetical protein